MDKLMHFLCGYFIFTIFVGYSLPLAIVAVVLAAVGKELYDKYIKGTIFNVYDVIATILGGVGSWATPYIVVYSKTLV